MQVLDRFVIGAWVVERRLVGVSFENSVGDRNVHHVAELLEVIERQLLHLVGRVTALERRPEAVPLDCLGEDDCRLARVLRCCLERRIDLAVVVPAALEPPDLVVGEVFDHLECARIAAEEVLANVFAVLCFVGLVVAVGSAIHQIAEGALGVFCEQGIPLAAPDDLDDVPASTTEEALEFLNDLAVAANGAVESLEVAVDHEVEVVEPIVGRPLQSASAFDFIHFAVAKERPDLLVACVLDTAMGQVAVRLRLIDRVDRAEAHRDGRKLPELRHEARVRIAGESVRGTRLLLPEAVELVFAQASLEKRASVHSGRGVSLIENLVAAASVILTTEKVVVPDLIEGCGTGIGRDVAADTDTGPLRTVHGDRGVPANPGTVLALELFVAREDRLVFWCDRVEVVGGRHHRHTEMQFFGSLQQAEHDVSATLVAVLRDEGVE